MGVSSDAGEAGSGANSTSTVYGGGVDVMAEVVTVTVVMAYVGMA